MTKPEPWKTIGDAFNTPFEDRTEKQLRLAGYGICDAIKELNPTAERKMIDGVMLDLDEGELYFRRIRGLRVHGYSDRVFTLDPAELLEADAFRAKYCYERMEEATK